MATVATVKTTLHWFSSWRRHKSDNQRRQSEFFDIGLLVDTEGNNVITRNDELQENSSCTSTEIPGRSRLALKMMTTSSPKHMRYFGFEETQMTKSGATCYLCQHSMPAEEEHKDLTIESYMQKFGDRTFWTEQTYHIHMIEK